MPVLSKPGPRLAVVAGTMILTGFMVGLVQLLSAFSGQHVTLSRRLQVQEFIMIESEFKFNTLPQVSDKRIAVRVTPSAEKAIRSDHPWLYESGITSLSHPGQAGDLAVVFDRKRRFLAIGLYDPDSPIRVKLLQQGTAATIDAAWFNARLNDALALRAPLPATGTTGYRLVNGENDGLPGLIVDKYERLLVVKLYTMAWLPHLQLIVQLLRELTSAETIILRLSRRVQAQTNIVQDGIALVGQIPTEPLQFSENKLLFEADVIEGQKTGFFLDQRDNRERVRELAADKHVLDVFAASGGFSVYAAAGGAKSVVSLDSSQPALEAAQRNMALNQQQRNVAATRHEIVVDDAFAALTNMGRANKLFDLVVLDPPSFAQRQADIENALQSYARLTALGLGVLRPGGVLVQASCSSRISADLFYDTVNAAARQAHRHLHEIGRTGHPLDHPVTFPEGAYLKCLFATTPS
jgi:23S rRNA (cytosine1962-C5)-methyltransferase